MTIGKDSGVFREILTKVAASPSNPKFHTFSVGDPFYSTFLDIGYRYWFVGERGGF
jgi:hypothetical protein